MNSNNQSVNRWIILGCGLTAMSLSGCDDRSTVQKVTLQKYAVSPLTTPDLTVLPTTPTTTPAAPSEVEKPQRHYDINFASGSTELSEADSVTLVDIALYLHRNPDLSVKLTGHIDSSGSAALNRRLARSRIKKAAEFLKWDAVDDWRIVPAVIGKADDIPPKGMDRGQWNRRLSIDFVYSGNS